MRARSGRFEYEVLSGSETFSGHWLADSTNSKRLAGAEISREVICTESTRTSVVLASADTSLRFIRRGVRVVEALRLNDGVVVAQYYALPPVRKCNTYIALSNQLQRDERPIVLNAMASGVVLLLRPFSRVAVVHWPFSWNRPAFVERKKLSR
jgi:hypothetical protein